MRIIDTSQLEAELENATQNELYWVYNGLDCAITYEIRDKLKARLDHVARVTYERALDLQAPYLEMMLRGVKLSSRLIEPKIVEFEKNIARLEHILEQYCREGLGLPSSFNWRSPVQLKTFFYGVLGLNEVKKRNAAGAWEAATDRETLEKLAAQYQIAEPFVNVILALRDAGKALGFLRTPVDTDGRIRCNFNLAGTNTGRLSSSFSDFGSGTNLQNVARELKDVFIPDEGKVFVNIDLEQADSRNVGALCWELFYDSHGPEFAGAYLDACESGDLHTAVCRMAWTELPWGDDPAGWRAVADQIAYRTYSYRDMSKKLGHGCLTDDHEVLTPEGWVSIAQMPQTIMAWNPHTRRLQWEQPSNWENKPWHGDIYYISGNGYSMCATADHRMPVFRRDGQFFEQPAEALKNYPQFNLRQQGFFVGGDAQVTPAQARLCAAAQADAHIYENGSVRFGFSKERKKARLMKLLQDAGLSPKITEYPQRSETYYHLPAEKVKFPAIKRAGSWMLNWSYEALAAWVDELKYWDGSIQPNHTWISGKDREHMEWMYLICKLVGQGASYAENAKFDCARVGINRRQNRRIGSLKITRAEGKGVQVYCPTVPSSGFLYRRNGVIGFSLNTNYYGQPATMAMHTKVAKEIIAEFQRKYFGAFPCIPEWHKWTINQLQTTGSLTHLFGRRRYFFGRYDDQSTINAAIAYSPQGMTGDEINIGVMNLWRHGAYELLIQVHDSILFQIDQSRIDELVPLALELLKAKLTLRGGREFFVPVEAKVGWNWGDVNDKTNPFGLKKWKGSESRVPPRDTRPDRISLRSLL